MFARSTIPNKLSSDMAGVLDAAEMVREARVQAGLSQRRLAERAGTTQSVVARIETGTTDPGTNTLARLLRAAGYEARCELRPVPVAGSHMLDDVPRILALSPEERLLEVANLSVFLGAVRRV